MGLAYREPVAIIGMGCRFPGSICSPGELWDYLVAERNATREIPSDRWQPYHEASPLSAQAAREAVQHGAYLDRIDEFDTEFFGVAPREAELMDPQQRMALEVAWEALEHAGVAATSLAGTDTAVFMGVCADDYGRRLLENLPRLQAWTGIGSSLCAVANRISYALDLRGPSVAIDTACSASLVAVHQACQALRAGESSLALAGGVMLVASPSFALVLRAAGALSPDGRSKPFDVAADGYGRGEGCGVLVLKRLGDAQRDGDRILAVIRGSAVAQDGRTNGIMAPSRAAQEQLLRIACRDAGLAPVELDYVEAHGTGTELGDVTEAHALGAVVGENRAPTAPCLIGSVKANIGHLEAASGVAGIIKTVLAMHYGWIPPTPVPTGIRQDIPWSQLGLRVVTEAVPWPRAGRPRRAGVGNYGYGGTIAHVIVEQGPQSAPEPHVADDCQPRLYPLSGASEANVTAGAGALADWVAANAEVPLDSMAHTLALRRSALPVRATVVATNRSELVERLNSLAEGRPCAGVSIGRARRAAETEPVWVFSGHGSQWPSMGSEMVWSEPEFAAVLDELTPIYKQEMGFSPTEYLTCGDYADVATVQAMIFAVQIGLARTWQHLGVRPAAIIGHSVGEIAAAVTAGVLSLPDAALLVCRRSTMLRKVAGMGAMYLVTLPFEEVRARLAGVDEVCAAVSASPRSAVVSGPTREVTDLVNLWALDDEVAIRKVDSDVAFHSSQMDGLAERLATMVTDIRSHPPAIPVYTTALDDPRSSAPRNAQYWATNLRSPVRFAEAVAAAVEDGHKTFVEVSPHPVVAHSITETLEALGVSDGVVASTLRRNRPERHTLLENLGTVHCAGATVNWAAVQPTGSLVDLPTMAWNHRRYWVGGVVEAGPRTHDVHSHTLLGRPTEVQTEPPVTVWQTDLDDATRPYPGRHGVLDAEVVPAAVLLTTFLTAARSGTLHDIRLRVPLGLTVRREVQVVRSAGTLRLSSRPVDTSVERWLTHATAVITGESAAHAVPPPTVPTEPRDPHAVAARLNAIGVAGIGFPWEVEELGTAEDYLRATVTADPLDGPAARTWASLLDAVLSIAPILFPGEPLLRMPGHIGELHVVLPPPLVARVDVRLIGTSDDGRTVTVNCVFWTPQGLLAGAMRQVRFGAVEQAVRTELTTGPGPDDDVTDPDLQALDGAELRTQLLNIVREVAAGELRFDPVEMDIFAPLTELGADSLVASAIRARLAQRLRMTLPGSLLWIRPTVSALTDYLVEHAGKMSRT